MRIGVRRCIGGIVRGRRTIGVVSVECRRFRIRCRC